MADNAYTYLLNNELSSANEASSLNVLLGVLERIITKANPSIKYNVKPERKMSLSDLLKQNHEIDKRSSAFWEGKMPSEKIGRFLTDLKNHAMDVKAVFEDVLPNSGLSSEMNSLAIQHAAAFHVSAQALEEIYYAYEAGQESMREETQGAEKHAKRVTRARGSKPSRA